MYIYRSGGREAERESEKEREWLSRSHRPLSRRVTDRIYKRVSLQLNDDSFSGGTLPKKSVHLLLSAVFTEILVTHSR